MADIFLTPPRGPDPYNHRSSRVDRERQSDHSDAIDRIDEPVVSGAARMLVQVFDGGSIPTTSEKVFYTHPVLATGTESEATAATLTVDSNTTVPVVVLGKAPSVGDYLTVYLCSGKWVTELLTNGTQCYVTACLPCGIPKGDLGLAWTDTIGGNGTATLVFDGFNTWQSACVNHGGGGVIYKITCTAGDVIFTVTHYASTICSGAPDATCASGTSAPHFLPVSASTCNPFSLTYTVDGTNCPGLSTLGYTQFVVTGPNYPGSPFGACPVCFTVTGCNGHRVVGATIIVTSGMVTVATGTTNANGMAVLDIGTTGTYGVNVTMPGYFSYFNTQMLSCNQAITVNLVSCIPTGNRTMTVAGMTVAGCVEPTYNGTFTLLGTTGPWNTGAVLPGGGFAVLDCRPDGSWGFAVSVAGEPAETNPPVGLTPVCTIPISTFSCSPFQIILGPVSSCTVPTDCYNWTSITIT